MLPFSKAHLALLDPREEDIARYGQIDEFMNNPLADEGICFTAVADGRVLVVGGILMVSMHTAYGWTIIGRHAFKHGRAVFYAVKQQLESIMRDFELHRVETSNLADAKDHHRWSKLLGFEEEGPLWQYDDQGRDYIRFAKLIKKGG